MKECSILLKGERFNTHVVCCVYNVSHKSSPFFTSVKSGWFIFLKQVLSIQISEKKTSLLQELLCVTTTETLECAHFEFSRYTGSPDDLHKSHGSIKRVVGVGIQLLNKVVHSSFQATQTY